MLDDEDDDDDDDEDARDPRPTGGAAGWTTTYASSYQDPRAVQAGQPSRGESTFAGAACGDAVARDQVSLAKEKQSHLSRATPSLHPAPGQWSSPED